MSQGILINCDRGRTAHAGPWRTGQRLDNVLTGRRHVAKIIVAVPIEGVLAGASLATMHDRGHHLLMPVEDFNRRPGASGKVQVKDKLLALLRQTRGEVICLGIQKKRNRPGEQLAQ